MFTRNSRQQKQKATLLVNEVTATYASDWTHDSNPEVYMGSFTVHILVSGVVTQTKQRLSLILLLYVTELVWKMSQYGDYKYGSMPILNWEIRLSGRCRNLDDELFNLKLKMVYVPLAKYQSYMKYWSHYNISYINIEHRAWYYTLGLRIKPSLQYHEINCAFIQR